MHSSHYSAHAIAPHRRLAFWLAASLVLALTTGALVQRSEAQQYSWSTFAGAAGVSGSADTPGYFNLPFGIARDSSGNVYVADYGNHVIRQITPGGVISTFAGQVGVPGSANGAKTTTARFFFPAGVAVDSANNLYVTDFGNHTIRKISGGNVETLAGTVGVAGGVDGTGPAASFNGPGQVTCDTFGNLYLGDFNGHTIRKVTPAGVVTTLAGLAGNSGSVDGTGDAARFNQPTGVAVDAQGTVYVCDENNGTIRKITPAGVVTTLAGLAGSPGSVDGTGSAARFTSVYGLTFDSAGNLIVTDRVHETIRRVTPAGVVTTLAGLPGSHATTDGTGSNARFNQLGGVINDGTSNTLLVVETNGSVIRRVSYDGVCTTWVGTPGVAGAASTAGVLNRPAGIARAPDGTWYVAEYGSHTIRKITPNGVVTVFAGQAFTSGSADGTGGAARFSGPVGVECDSAGNVFVADQNNHSIRKITPAGVVTTFAGLSGSSGSTDGTGSAARFHFPSNLSFDNSGNLYVPDAGSHIIRKITPAGVVTTLAGQAGSIGFTDGTGNAARFNVPVATAVDAAGNVFVADNTNHAIRKVTQAGVVTTVAGSLLRLDGSTDGIGTAARFLSPRGLAFDAAGNLLIAEQHNYTIRKMTPAGVVTTVCGQAGTAGTADGVGAAAQFNWPSDIDMDPQGNAYVANDLGHTIRKVTPGGAVTTWLGTPGLAGTTNTGGNFAYPSGTAVDAAGNVYVVDSLASNLRKISPSGVISTLAGLAFVTGSLDGMGTAAQFKGPTDVAIDAAGNLYVTDFSNHTIRQITPAGEVTTLAGQAGAAGSADGTGSAARFANPRGLCVDAAGANLYVADQFNQTIRQVVIATRAVTTLAGTAGVSGSTDATGTAARFNSPTDTAVDAAGNVYVADFGNGAIRKITPGGVVTTFAGLAGASGSADGIGTAARFTSPYGLALDTGGSLYVSEIGNNTIRRVNTGTAAVTTIGGLAGSPGSADGTGSVARFMSPQGIAIDAWGRLYVCDRLNATIRKGRPLTAKARMTSPALGAALPAPTTVFEWEPGTGATQYALFIGTTPGAYNLYSGVEGTNLSKTVALPPDTKVYVTLYSLISGAWQSNSYAYEPAPSAKAVVTSPVQASTLTSSTLSLQWAAATGASQYAIWVGNSYGAYDLGAGAYSTDTNTATFTGIPTDGGPVYVTLWSLINGSWQRSDHWYFTQTGAGNRPATMTVTAPGNNGSTIPSGTVIFGWLTDPGVGATSYAIWIGSTPGGYDIYSALTGTGTFVIPTNIPGDGRRIYVTLWSLIGGAYLSNSYWFTCSNNAAPSAIATPVSGSVLGTTQAFTWSSNTLATNYALWIGSAPGGYDLYAGNEGLNTARTVTGLPADGRVIHATVWSLISGTYQSSASWFYAAPDPQFIAGIRLTSHSSGQSLNGATTNFTWGGGGGYNSNHYPLWIGSTPGAADLYNAVETTNSHAITLPTDGRKLYFTLWCLIGGVYKSNSYLLNAASIPPQKAVLTSPAFGSTLTGSTATLNWTTGTGVTSYYLFVGSTPGGYDLGAINKGTATTHNLTGLPTDGRPIHVTLYSLINGVYQASASVVNAWQSP